MNERFIQKDNREEKKGVRYPDQELISDDYFRIS
jgi:hypothetical protein